ncbi:MULTISPECIES: helix-turn-helix domain-containing protein [Tenebrionibacter/Tenebrionicola group]|uniref:Helix-turn-helix transcriptional regulator n=2 Tax=Tenebrionibacter/Tenebrionicola group TaxID=2969848 RepID=A0A8K0XXD1_9ENTR|nr:MULTISPECIES: XRE family transcriptional regulator [Tenebrionibacter/Tenebrionicola group]MBK4715563.1 helix-turn-helix transcriptional regulator [Tenebrionibacter intestinalis]MBV4411365.1 helix-turn-helix transcriptional regulator [Tenebrionicola larvae]MBV5095806.1 helix-turn-helix transcriptional regulator [Tenebrionicola larvae]
MNINNILPSVVRQLRQARAWSLSQAAERTGVSKAMLGQIERGESSPTVATLWKIATGFNVPFSAFFSEPPLAPADASGQMTAVPLFPYDAALRFDLLVVTLPAGALSESSPHEQGVIEDVVVIEGVLELGRNGRWQRLAVGEGLRFPADSAHSYRNSAGVACRFHSLIHYPMA